MLLKYKTEGISVIAILDRRRKKNNGLFPVKIEVVFKGCQRYFPTGQDTSEEEWLTLSHKRNLSEKYYEVQDAFGRVKNEVKRLVALKRFSMIALTQALKTGADVSLGSLIEQKMNQMRSLGKTNSYYRYRTSLRAVNRSGLGTCCIDELGPSLLLAFEKALRGEGKSDTTINIYMSAIRSVVSDAIKSELMDRERNPFGRGRYTLPSSVPRDLALTKAQIAQIAAYRGTPAEERYRDLWLFSYLCNGINFRDMLFLQYGNISEGEISFIRSKTSGIRPRIIRCALTPEMMKIIRLRGNPYTGSRETYIFRYAKGGESEEEKTNLVRKVNYLCNRALKSIAAHIGIPHLSVYSARHSFATVLRRQGVDLALISECLGHSSIAVTQNYLGGSDAASRQRVASLIDHTVL
ncbi:MAG: tyrosine-type recombinase/integrase [Candidatus Cryptobacteroides sp.]